MGLLYYFATLPPLKWGTNLPISAHECLQGFKANFSHDERRQLRALRFYFDVFNVLQMIVSEDYSPEVLHPWGNFSRPSLRSMMENPEEFPPPFESYFRKRRDPEQQLEEFDVLLNRVFHYKNAKKNAFMVHFFEFERDLRIVLTGYRAKERGEDIATHLNFSDRENLLLKEVVEKNKGGQHFTFPYEFQKLGALLQDVKGSPRDQYDVVNQYRFTHYYRTYNNQPFTMDAVFAYLVSLWILEDYCSIHADGGFDQLVKIVEMAHAS